MSGGNLTYSKISAFILCLRRFDRHQLRAAQLREWFEGQMPLLRSDSMLDSWYTSKSKDYMMAVLAKHEFPKTSRRWKARATELAQLNRRLAETRKKLVEISGLIYSTAPHYGYRTVLPFRRFSQALARGAFDDKLDAISLAALDEAKSLERFLKTPRSLRSSYPGGHAAGTDAGVSPTTSDPVLDKIDVEILTALSKTPHAMMLCDLAQASGYVEKTCGVHVARLIGLGYSARKSKRSGVSITATGRARINPLLASAG
jgi:hypothetical protein